MSRTTILGASVTLGVLLCGFAFVYGTPIFHEYGESVPSIIHPKSTTLLFTGDILLARDVERLMHKHGSDYPYRQLAPVFAEADFVISNFESSVPSVHHPTGSMQMTFSTDPAHLTAFADSGITHTSLANNHSDDYGVTGYRHTVAALEDVGIAPFGAAYDLSTSSVAFVDTVHGRIGLIGVYAVDVIPSESDVNTVLGYAARKSDVQIVYVHWGTEYESMHSRNQEQIARMLVRSGADFVIGHHPHVVQDIQMLDGVPVFYSLGNTIFDQYFSVPVQQGLLLSLSVDTTDVSARLIPISSLDSYASPHPMTGVERAVFLDELAERSDSVLRRDIKAGRLQFDNLSTSMSESN